MKKNDFNAFPARAMTFASLALLASACSTESGSGGLYGVLTSDQLSDARVGSRAAATCDTSARCSVSPSNYTLGYTQVALASLTDTSKITSETSSLEPTDIDSSTELFSSTSATEFQVPEGAATAFTDVSLDGVSGDFDGILVTYAYIQQTLDTDTLGSSTIEGWDTYRICLQTGVCGLSSGQIGDYLLQGIASADSTNGWGFIHYTGCTAGSEGVDDTSCTGYGIEKTSRPTNLSATDSAFAEGVVAGKNWHVVKTTGTQLTSYQVFYAFDEDTTTGDITHSIDPDTTITVNLSTYHSFEWHIDAMLYADLIGSGDTAQPAKVGNIPGMTTNPTTTDTFDPADDNAFLPVLPSFQVTVEAEAATADTATGT